MIAGKVITTEALTEATQLSEENFSFLRAKIHQHSGIVIENSKRYLLEARLLPVVQRYSLKSLNELSGAMRSRPEQYLNEVVESMTTHESYFFRDSQQFDVLRNHLIPELLRHNQKKRRMSIWSAAASSGQEAYSVAMTTAEMRIPHWSFDITATDLSEKILSRARAGIYSAHEIERGLPADYKCRYFKTVKQGFQADESIRRMVDFRRFDLRQSMRPLGTFDVILCRNVLIYFDMETKRKIFNELASVLSPNGFLLLGGSETTLGISDRFQRQLISGAVAYRLPAN